MARLRIGEKSQKMSRLEYALSRFYFGIREIELASELGWNRRTLNNYLHSLEQQNKIYKEGRNWYAYE